MIVCEQLICLTTKSGAKFRVWLEYGPFQMTHKPRNLWVVET